LRILDFKILEELYYTKKHNWLKFEEDKCRFGMTDYFQKMLRGWAFRAPSEIVHVELPKVNSKVSKLESIGSIESIKAVSDICAPISGEVIEVNEKLFERPELIGDDPYKDGYLASIKPSDLDNEIKLLLDSTDYYKYLERLIKEREHELKQEYEEMLKKTGLKEKN
jgi:glycine cleavage system H protein